MNSSTKDRPIKKKESFGLKVHPVFTSDIHETLLLG